MLASINWSADPEIFAIGSLSIRYYGVLFALGFIIGYQIMYWMFKVEGRNLKDLELLTLVMVISTIVGARLGHCFFYDPAYYLSNPIEILMIRKGGLASHGAAIAIIIGLWIFIKMRPKFTYLWVIDRIAVVVALAGAFIRIGNFVNSEILGLPADVSWAVVFTRIDDVARHPVQLYEAFSYLAIFAFLMLKYNKKRENSAPGYLLGMFMLLVFGARFIMEFFKTRQAAFDISFLTMGQILSIPFVIIGIWLVLRAIKITKSAA